MEETQLPPGFRFHPTDEELITYYLTNKVSDFDFTTKAVADVDLNKCEPWDLPAKASMGEKEWYFFSLRDRKYPTGLRTNRATEAGYWKTTGKDKEIYRGNCNVLVGLKKTLVFYRGRAPKGEKTNWVMHEYRLHNNLAYKSSKEEWVICRVFQKSLTIKRPQQTPSSPPSQADESPCDAGMAMVNELGDMDMPNYRMSISQSTNNNMIALQNYNNSADHTNMMMSNWNEAASNSLPSITWPLLSTNLSMNSLLLTALQLRGHQQQQQQPRTMINENYSFAPPLVNANYDQYGNGNDFVSNFNMGGGGSTSGVVESVPQPPSEQPPYHVDSTSIW